MVCVSSRHVVWASCNSGKVPDPWLASMPAEAFMGAGPRQERCSYEADRYRDRTRRRR